MKRAEGYINSPKVSSLHVPEIGTCIDSASAEFEGGI